MREDVQGFHDHCSRYSGLSLLVPISSSTITTKYYHRRARSPLLLLLALLLFFLIGVYVTSHFIDANFTGVAENMSSKTILATSTRIKPPPSQVPQIPPRLIPEEPTTEQIPIMPSTKVPNGNNQQPSEVKIPKEPPFSTDINPGKPQSNVTKQQQTEITQEPPRKVPLSLNCSSNSPSCPTYYYHPKSFQVDDDRQPSTTCPEYFRWIHEDLRPWNETGITKEMVERGRRTASFRLVVVNGTAFLETYKKGFQSRDSYTVWGILQLLRRYPGKLPDLDLMFDCSDWPVVLARNHRGPNATAPPPLFAYCRDEDTLDLVFPDWSFWGWPEINIKPWETLLMELKEGNIRKEWTDRDPHAYWKGNPYVAKTRVDLLKCNVSDNKDWGARIYVQDWLKETQQGFKQSDLARQCLHRFKIYVEGSAWSVSEKYILACNSVTLFVKPRYYDFFTRGLLPMQHYWPIKDDDKCRSIKFAVEWGNNHTREAQEIGKAAGNFIQDELKMDYVYDYMFHILNKYGKLLRYKPTVPRKAIELCPEKMACNASGLTKKFMVESMVNKPAEVSPCTMPPPYDPTSIASIATSRRNSERRVDSWEKQYWMNRI